MKKIITGILFILFITSSLSFAQDRADERAIIAQLETMFNGMRAGDSAMVSSVFHPKATMRSIGRNQQGQVQLFEGSLDRFLTAVGTPHDQVWDERIVEPEITIDGDMAHAWVPYSFYIGDRFSHCGVNSFQFFKEDGIWRAINIVDTRRPENCVEDL